MKRILITATGDTIAYSCHGTTGVATGAELLTLAPVPVGQADMVVEDVLAEPSWDMSPPTMLGLARRVRAALLDDGFDGVVVTHGLDTLEDTAFLTDLMAGDAAAHGVIVFTGAQRCLDDPASDGPQNLASAIVAATDTALRGAGAVICVNGELHAARWARHVDPIGLPAFTSAPFPMLGRVVAGRVEITAPAPRRPPEATGDPESDVALIKTYPGMTPMLLTTVVDAGARGVVLEGTGAGNVPVELFTTISELSDWDIPVVVTSRCQPGGKLVDDIRPDLGLATKVGAISARGLAPSQARAALMVALGAGSVGTSVTVVRDWFDQL
jgi:L-asparaginase